MDVLYVCNNEQFIWDETKARMNRRKHGVSFEEACEAFFDPFYQAGDASEKCEHREFLIGFSLKRRLLLVVHTERGENTRVISARKATNKERQLYEEA